LPMVSRRKRRKTTAVYDLGGGALDISILENAVTIRVFQGERELAADNLMLGRFDLVFCAR
jgi:molecular chaperone DnaK (HSP70)